MLTSDFDFELPPELIAQTPPPERTQSRMMVLDRASGRVAHRGIVNLGEYLRAGDVLVVNNTRVMHARFFGRREDTGGRVEVLLLEDLGEGCWEALYRASGHPRVGLAVELAGAHLRGEVTAVRGGGRVILRLHGDEPVARIMEARGTPPLPPYILRDSGEDEARRQADCERYQTVYAQHAGAVAAPTAGLHFTPELLAALQGQGVDLAMLTLHVGLGTFRPVKTEQVADHTMEPERYVLDAAAAATIRRARQGGGRVVAVGSTTVRTLETVLREHGELVACTGRSALFIHPPFAFRAVDAMLTNFHLPRSTLIMMVSAFAEGGRRDAQPDPVPAASGRETMMRAYREAIRERYRFYSYGDCMLML